MNQEHNLIREWQRDQDPNKLGKILTGIAPLIGSITKKWSGGGVSNKDLDIRAKSLAVEALKDFNPTQAALSTHLNNRLQKVSRTVYRNTGIITIPEHRAMQVGNYKRSIASLTDKFGREPTAQEIADDMGLPIKEIHRLGQEVRVTLMSNNVNESEIFGETINYDPAVFDALNALQFGMSTSEKNIFQDITGFGNGATMKPGAVAKKHGLSGTKISRLKTKWAKEMEDYL